ncbi:hypothetical protein JCM8547_008740 [Rhodosporidiobolus lusitaniae]
MRSAHYPCEGCNLYHRTEVGRYEHGRQAHPFCEAHRRAFKSEANLKAHLASSSHVSRNVACPTGCGKAFVSTAAAILHLESDSCTSGLTHIRLNRFIQQLDRHHVFTNPNQKLLTDGGEELTTRLFATQRSYVSHLRAYVGRDDREAIPLPERQLGEEVLDAERAGAACRGWHCGVWQMRGVQQTLENVMGGMKRLTL